MWKPRRRTWWYQMWNCENDHWESWIFEGKLKIESVSTFVWRFGEGEWKSINLGKRLPILQANLLLIVCKNNIYKAPPEI